MVENDIPGHLPLEVIIVGAGIAGLSAAIALRRAGHNTTIIERSSMSNEIGAAIHVCPNASRVLLPWGFDPVRTRLVRTRWFTIARGDSLQPIVNMSHAGLEERFGAPFYFSHRVDLHEELKRLAVSVDGPGRPTQLRLGTAVVDYDPESGIVRMSDGSKVRGDLVVGADGIHSKAVEFVQGRKTPVIPSGSSCLRFLVDTQDILNDPESAPLMEDGDGKFRAYVINENDRLVWYPCRDNQIQNMALIYGDTDEKWEPEDWDRPATQETLLKIMKGFHPSLIAACKKGKNMRAWRLLRREPLSSWHRSRLVIIGDAAHPMLPHQGQAGAQAIEDGAALGKLFVNFYERDADSISRRLDLFEKVRMNRASAIQMFSNGGQDQVEKTTEAASKYVPDGKLPRDSRGFEEFNYGPDVIRDCEKELAMLTAY